MSLILKMENYTNKSPRVLRRKLREGQTSHRPAPPHSAKAQEDSSHKLYKAKRHAVIGEYIRASKYKKGEDREDQDHKSLLFMLRILEVAMIALASGVGIYFAYKQTQINTNMMTLQTEQLNLQEKIEHQHREELIAKYMGALETGKLSEQLGAVYALSQIEGDEPIGALSRGLVSDYDSVGETAYRHIIEHARPDVKISEMDAAINEYKRTRALLEENPSLRPKKPIGFDEAVSVALQVIRQNPADETKINQERLMASSLAVPTEKRPKVVERAIRLLNQLPDVVFSTGPEGYGPSATVHLFFPPESRWPSSFSLAEDVAVALYKNGYLQADDAHRYDRVRAAAVVMLNLFRHAETITDSQANDKTEIEPELIWMMGQLIARCNLRTANINPYSIEAIDGYPLAQNVDEKASLKSLKERMVDFLWFAESSEEARSAAILSLDQIRESCKLQGLGDWWLSTWQELHSNPKFQSLNGPVKKFALTWDYDYVTDTEAQYKTFKEDVIEEARTRLLGSQ